MLDVERRDDVDAGVEQLLDVLPALLVARARDVRVRELVDERDLRLAGEDRVDVHLLERRAAVLDRSPRDDLEVADLLGGLRPAVGLDEADDDVGRRARAGAGPRRASRRSCRRPGRRRGRCGAGPLAMRERPTARGSSSARLSSSTFTPGSPRNPSERPSRVLVDRAASTSRAAGPGRARPRRLQPGVRGRDVRVEARAGRGHRVDRHVGVGREPVLARGTPRRARARRRQQLGVRRPEVRGRARPSRRSRRRPPTARRGSTRRPSNGWPISCEPTTGRRARRASRPPRLGNATCATPVTTSG